MHEQTQGDVVHSVAFGEGKRASNETAQALAQGAVPTFDVVGLAFRFAAETVGALWKGRLVSQRVVVAGGPRAVVRRDALAQGAGTLR